MSGGGARCSDTRPISWSALPVRVRPAGTGRRRPWLCASSGSCVVSIQRGARTGPGQRLHRPGPHPAEATPTRFPQQRLLGPDLWLRLHGPDPRAQATRTRPHDRGCSDGRYVLDSGQRLVISQSRTRTVALAEAARTGPQSEVDQPPSRASQQPPPGCAPLVRDTRAASLLTACSS